MATRGFEATLRLICALFALWVFVPGAQAQSASWTAITGVYNGTRTCNDRTGKIQLTIVAAPDASLTGYLTMDLPPNLGSRATHSLTGRYFDGAHRFSLTPGAWVTAAPPDYPMAELNGVYQPGSDMIYGRNMICDFTVTRDKTETPTSIAEALKKAPPPIPPVKKACELVTKADAESILSTTVFMTDYSGTGACLFTQTGFTDKTPNNRQLRFTIERLTSPRPDAYAAYANSHLPTDVVKDVPDLADAALWRWDPIKVRGWLNAFKAGTLRVEVTISGLPEDAALQNAKMLAARGLGGTGGTGHVYARTRNSDPVVSCLSETQPAAGAGTVPTGLVRKSKKYWNAYRTEAIRQIFDGNSPSDANYDVMDFFKKETCQSAAMHQLGENLLRAALGNPSLQDAGATIVGAAVESDTSVPAGRFERFVDGCHAYFRTHAREREISGRDMGIWCECLGEKYKRVMSAEEQCVYANDFEKRYMQRIAGVVSSPDPDWPRLHEVVQQCAR